MSKNYFIKIFSLGLIFSLYSEASTSQMQSEINDINDRLLNLELRSLARRLDLGGRFHVRYTNLKNEEYENDTNPDKVQNFRMKLDLNLNANLNSNLNFYSTLSMAKSFNESIREGTPLSQAAWRDYIGTVSYEQGPALWVNRAYIDYKIPSTDLSFFIGRLPTIEGPPQHFYEQRERLGTYPLLSYNMILDGLGFDYNTSKYLPKDHELRIRYLYTPTGFVNRASKNKQARTLNPDGSSRKLDSYDNFSTVMIDYKLKKLSWMEEFTFIYHYFYVANQKVNLLGFFDGYSSLRNDFQASSRVQSFYFEFKRLFNLPFDLAIAHAMNREKAKGDLYYEVATNVFSPAGIANGRTSGHGTLISLAYHLPFEFMLNPSFGLEYFRSSKDYLMRDFASDDLTGFKAQMGRYYHVYWFQPTPQGPNLRLGYIQHQRHYNFAASGAVSAGSQQRIREYYVGLSLDF